MSKIGTLRRVCKFLIGAILVYGLAEVIFYFVDQDRRIYSHHFYPYIVRTGIQHITLGIYLAGNGLNGNS